MSKGLGKIPLIAIQVILGGLLGLGLFWFGLAAAIQFGPHHLTGLAVYLWFFFLAAFLMFCAAVIIHELAHLLAALALDLRIIFFRLGPVAILRAAKGFKLQRTSGAPRMLGGVAALPKGGRISRWRMVIFVVAGSVANLMVATLCFWGVYWLNEATILLYPSRPLTFWNKILVPRSQAASCLSIAGLMNLICFIEILVPARRKGVSSDAARLLDLLRKGTLGDIDWLVTILHGALLDGIRPRDWNSAYVEAMLTARTGTPKDAIANLFAYYHARDTGRIDLAGQLIDLAVAQRQGYPLALHPSILLEAAYFEGRYRHNAAGAREWLQQAQRGQVESQTRLRAEAAVLWAEGRFADAAAKVQEGLAVLAQSADPGGALAEEDWLKDVLERSQES
jgi:hypothetical protein